MDEEVCLSADEELCLSGGAGARAWVDAWKSKSRPGWMQAQASARAPSVCQEIAIEKLYHVLEGVRARKKGTDRWAQLRRCRR